MIDNKSQSEIFKLPSVEELESIRNAILETRKLAKTSNTMSLAQIIQNHRMITTKMFQINLDCLIYNAAIIEDIRECQKMTLDVITKNQKHDEINLEKTQETGAKPRLTDISPMHGFTPMDDDDFQPLTKIKSRFQKQASFFSPEKNNSSTPFFKH